MSWTVTIKKKLVKSLQKLPKNIRDDFEALILDLKISGPVRGDWPIIRNLRVDDIIVI